MKLEKTLKDAGKMDKQEIFTFYNCVTVNHC